MKKRVKVNTPIYESKNICEVKHIRVLCSKCNEPIWISHKATKEHWLCTSCEPSIDNLNHQLGGKGDRVYSSDERYKGNQLAD